MPIRLCLEPRCSSEATYRGRCRVHSRGKERQTHRNKSFYNSKAWRMLRRAVLFDEPLCRRCGEVATDVDHIVPIEDGGAKLDRSNCQPLCGPHHGQKTRREQATT